MRSRVNSNYYYSWSYLIQLTLADGCWEIIKVIGWPPPVLWLVNGALKYRHYCISGRQKDIDKHTYIL